MKKIKNIFLIALIVSLICQVTVVADTPTVIYDNIASISAMISRDGSTATCNASYIASSSKFITMKMKLQRSSDNSKFTNIKTWTTSSAGTGVVAMSRSAALTKGYYYRVKVALIIYSGDTVVETVTKYSSVISY